jgi:predicted transglutaminase-like cysteine proteinase
MRLTALPLALTAPFLALTMPNPGQASALALPSQQCATPTLAESSLVATAAPEASMLDAIRMQQEVRLVASQPAVELRDVLAPGAIAIAPCVQSAPAGMDGVPTPPAQTIEQPFIPTDRPDVFGSIALPVSHTPLDAKWHAAYQARLSARSGPWASLVSSLVGNSRIHQLDTVNQWVNQRVHFTDDRSGKYGADQWASASVTLRSSRGDCEDYAIAKMKLLEAAGVARSDMYLVIANDLVRRADHATAAATSFSMPGKFQTIDRSFPMD